jgi:alginate O-acetyltransferase complex protein AlgI
MQFNSVTFFIFFGLILAGLAFLRQTRAKHYWLLAGSYMFYAWWDWRFLALMLFSSVSAYATGLALGNRAKNDPRRRRILWASVSLDLAVLGFFKYTNFFLDSLQPLFHALGWQMGALAIILPIGISFYTFEAISYKVDVHRSTLPAERDWLKIALFLAFFPRLVAGPIMRAKFFLPQLERDLKLTRENFFYGSQQFLQGLVKKILIADRLALFVDTVFANPAVFSSLTLWLAILAYAIQIYCDFSGYSDMALGLARMMDLRLPENFNLPYTATSLREFWRRWHISLSTWLTDYIYFSLGGLRKNRFNLYRNLMITMLLGGLWHGASWNFVAWGGLLGLALCAEHAMPANGRQRAGSFLRARKLFHWVRTMLIVLISWVFFRATDFTVAFACLRKMFGLAGGAHWLYTPFFIITPFLFAAHAIGRRYEQRRQTFAFAPGTIYLPALYLTAILALLLFAPSDSSPFIYFQF